MFAGLFKGPFGCDTGLKLAQKPSFAIFAIERRQYRVFGKTKQPQIVTWHRRIALNVMSITSSKASKDIMASPKVF